MTKLYRKIKFLTCIVLWYLYYYLFIKVSNIYFSFRYKLNLSKDIEYNGEVDFGNKICLFAAYPDFELDHQSYGHYLKSLKDLGFSIIFVSNAEISEESIDFLKKYCTKIVIRDNWGRCFGAYKFGIKKYEQIIRNASEFLLANDSNLGPLFDLDPIFKEMNQDYDFWGLNEGYNNSIFGKRVSNSYHYSSHFLVMSKKVLVSNGFWEFWNSYKNNNSRIQTIQLGEVKFSRSIFKNNLRSGCYITSEKLYKYVREQTNNFSDFNKILQITSNAFLRNYYTQIGDMSNIANDIPQRFLENTFYQMLHSSTSYGILQYIMMALGYPFIKKDAITQMQCTTEQIEPFIQHLPTDVRNDFMHILKAKANYSVTDVLTIWIGEK